MSYRYDHTGAQFDAFSYNYELSNGFKVNNRLLHVDDNPAFNSVSTEDIDDQSTGNYDYDELGNLIGDNAEEIKEITWRVDGKIAYIEYDDASDRDDLKFLYDGMGNRIAKIIKPVISGVEQSEDFWTYTYYVRDASGNIMAMYDKYTVINTYPTPSYKEIALKEQPVYGSSRLGVINRNKIIAGRLIIVIQAFLLCSLPDSALKYSTIFTI